MQHKDSQIMKSVVATVFALMMPVTTLAQDSQPLAVSSTCQIRSIPGGRDGSTVEYSWKIATRSDQDRIVSVEQLTRSSRPLPLPSLPDLRGYQRFLYCKAGSEHEKEIRLEVDQAPDGGERAYWFEGFLTSLINEDIPLPKSATMSVTTRQIKDDDKPGHLIGITVSDKEREISRHFIFISLWSPTELQNSPLWSEMTERERDLRDGNVYQWFTEAKSWEPKIQRFEELDR
jgi:hypothetical protein